jgi:Transcriptional regulator, AbiEi antitoxin, Type IV TA system
MTLDRRLGPRLHNATAAVLGELSTRPKVHVEATRADLAPVFEVVISIGNVEHRFTAGWAGAGWKPDVERLMAVAPMAQVVYARSLSDEAKEWLEEHRLGWVDEDGAASISLASGLVVVRDAHEIRKPKTVEDRWTRAMLAAAEAVLAGVPPTVEAVERATGMSRGGAANALARLERRELLARPGQKRGPGVSRQLVDIDTFIDQYTEAAAMLRAKQTVVLLHRLWTDPLDALATEIGPALIKEGVTWAVTGSAASSLLAPYLGNITIIDLYVEGALFVARDHLSTVLGGRAVDRGHRIEVRELPTSMSAKGPKVQGIHVALPARVYADLMAAGGRSAEAANHLREVRGVGPST